jgi:Tfp pilus assembly protein PilV
MKIKNQGFSLVEAIVGLLVFSVGMLMLVPLGVYSSKANQWSDKTSKATFYLQQKIEDLKNQDNPASGQDSLSGMQRVWAIQTLTPNLKQIDIRVNWRDFDNRPRQYRTVTYTSS